MKPGNAGLLALIAASAAAIAADALYASRFVPRFKEIEKRRIITSNQLATAKIVSENLSHVRELVFSNMDFPGQKDTVNQQSEFFDFLTASVRDLKMGLVSIRPLRPVAEGRVTTYGYDLQLEGDFFSLGELCAKLENSRRVLAITSLEVRQAGREPSRDDRLKGSARRGISIRMHIDTFRLRKG